MGPVPSATRRRRTKRSRRSRNDSGSSACSTNSACREFRCSAKHSCPRRSLRPRWSASVRTAMSWPLAGHLDHPLGRPLRSARHPGHRAGAALRNGRSVRSCHTLHLDWHHDGIHPDIRTRSRLARRPRRLRDRGAAHPRRTHRESQRAVPRRPARVHPGPRSGEEARPRRPAHRVGQVSRVLRGHSDASGLRHGTEPHHLPAAGTHARPDRRSRTRRSPRRQPQLLERHRMGLRAPRTSRPASSTSSSSPQSG